MSLLRSEHRGGSCSSDSNTTVVPEDGSEPGSDWPQDQNQDVRCAHRVCLKKQEPHLGQLPANHEQFLALSRLWPSLAPETQDWLAGSPFPADTRVEVQQRKVGGGLARVLASPPD